MASSTDKTVKDVSELVEEADKMRGAGDLVAKVTKKLGIHECAPCAERRRKLNDLIPFRKGSKK